MAPRHPGPTTDTPGTVRRVALCLYGKIGEWRLSSSSLPKSGSNRSVAAYAALAHSTIQRHILQANRRDGLAVDVFLHSWNPEVGPELDALYQPNASLHQQPLEALERVRSGHLSLKRVLLLLRAREVPGDEVSLIMLSRFDVLWYNDLLFRGLSSSRIWLPHHCQPVVGLRHSEVGALRSLCGSDRGALMEPAYTQRLFSVPLERQANYNSFVLDYWFISSVEVAETFGRIYHQFDEYTRQMARQLGWRPFNAAHFYWTHHISTLLRRSEDLAAENPSAALPLRASFTAQSEVDFNLARFYEFGSDCLVETSPIRDALSARLQQLRAKLTPNPFSAAGPMLGLGYARPPANRHEVLKSLEDHDERRANLSWLAAQCPQPLRTGRSLQCPWYSRRCSAGLQHRVRQMLLNAKTLKAHDASAALYAHLSAGSRRRNSSGALLTP